VTGCYQLTLERKNLKKNENQSRQNIDRDIYKQHPLDAPCMPDKPDELPNIKMIRCMRYQFKL